MKNCGFIAFLAFVTIMFSLVFIPSGAFADGKTVEVTANDYAGKFGIGFHSNFPLSGISGKYWTPTGIGIQGFLARAGMGISLSSERVSASVTMLGGRFLYEVSEKSRVRLYLGGGANYTSMEAEYEEADEDSFFNEEDSTSGKGIGFEGIGGVEYSFSDLPNLGFAFEFGINFLQLSLEEEEYEDDKLNLHFTTSGTVGIHYYF